MGFFASTDTKTMPADPYLQDLIGKMANFSPGGGMGRRLDRQLLHRFDEGGDVSDYGQLGGIRQLHAAQGRSIADEYTSGDNQLVANAGGDQAGLLQRQKEIALERNRESEGMETQQALTGLYDSTNNRLQANRQANQQMKLGALQGATGAQQNYYNSRYRLVNNAGWGNQLVGMASQLAGGAGGLMSGIGAVRRP